MADLAVAADLVVAAFVDLAVAAVDCASNTAAAADLTVVHDLHYLHSNYRYHHHHVVGHRDWDCRTADLAVVVDSDLNFHIGDWCYPVAVALGEELQRYQMEVVVAKEHHQQHLEEVGAIQ